MSLKHDTSTKRRRGSRTTARTDHPVRVVIDLRRIRAGATAIAKRVERPIIPVVKSDAYGLGATRVVEVLSDIAAEFATFTLTEAQTLNRPGIVLGPLSGTADAHAAISVRPAVGSMTEARAVARIPAALNVDTGMQRFGCAADQVDALLAVANVVEAFTHTVTVRGARELQRCCRGKVARLHAAGSALLDKPSTWLDAVRPGLALYLGAMTVTTRLITVRDLDGPAGYRRFRARRAGVIPCGYASGFGPGVVHVNGRRRRVLEVGMNTAFVEAGPRDGVGDEVVLLGGRLTEVIVAKALGCSQHEVLCRFSRLGPREYLTG